MRRRQMPWSINAFAALAGEIIYTTAHISKHQKGPEQEAPRESKELPGLKWRILGRANYHCAAIGRIFIPNAQCWNNMSRIAVVLIIPGWMRAIIG